MTQQWLWRLTHQRVSPYGRRSATAGGRTTRTCATTCGGRAAEDAAARGEPPRPDAADLRPGPAGLVHRQQYRRDPRVQRAQAGREGRDHALPSLHLLQRTRDGGDRRPGLRRGDPGWDQVGSAARRAAGDRLAVRDQRVRGQAAGAGVRGRARAPGDPVRTGAADADGDPERPRLRLSRSRSGSPSTSRSRRTSGRTGSSRCRSRTRR